MIWGYHYFWKHPHIDVQSFVWEHASRLTLLKYSLFWDGLETFKHHEFIQYTYISWHFYVKTLLGFWQNQNSPFTKNTCFFQTRFLWCMNVERDYKTGILCEPRSTMSCSHDLWPSSFDLKPSDDDQTAFLWKRHPFLEDSSLKRRKQGGSGRYLKIYILYLHVVVHISSRYFLAS